MKLFVGNLSFKVTDDDLLAAFGPLGQVISARVMKERDTGRSRGFAFVEMPNDAHARKAIETLNNQPICGRPVKVSEAHERQPRVPQSDAREK